MAKRLKRLRFLITWHRSIPFLIDFFRTKHVKKTTKLFYSALLIGYSVMPFDLIPDFLFSIGFIDDITVAVFLLQRMVKKAPADLKEKHQLE